jgi:hypothetical protein
MDINKLRLFQKEMLLFSLKKTLLMKSTGLLRELSHQLKIKDNVDHAGHFLPLDHSKVLTSSPLEILFHFLNQILSIAHG